MGIAFLLSNRAYDIKIWQDDCETNTSVPVLEYSDARSATQGFIDVDVNITINQADIEASEIWNATDGSFSFCLATTLYLNENKTEANVVIRKEQIFTVKVDKESGVGGGDFLDVDITVPGPDVTDDFVVDIDGNVTAYRCDPTTLDPLTSPDPLGPFSVLNICVEEVSNENITISSILDLTLEQNVTYTTFVAIENGVVRPGYEEVVMTSCSSGKCLAQIQLVNSFFLDDSSPPIAVTGTVLLAFGSSGRVVVDFVQDSPSSSSSSSFRSVRMPAGKGGAPGQEGSVDFKTNIDLRQSCEESDGGIFGGGISNMFSSVLDAVLKVVP